MLNALPSHRKEKGSRTRRIRIVDIVATDQNGERPAIDFMVTRAKPRAREALQAAKAGEKMKAGEYEKFLQKCAEEYPHNPRLGTEVIPVVFETHGAAGPSACRLVPFRVRIHTMTLSAHLNYLFRLQALTSKRIQRAVPLQGAQ